MTMFLPNYLTILRIILVPILVIAFYLPIDHYHWLAAGVFALAAVTDWLDGWLARNLGQTSKFGAFLDPVADKLIVAVSLVLLVSELPYLAIPSAIIIGREIIVSALREWMAELGKRTSIAVSYIAKIKTALQMIAIIFLLLLQKELFGVQFNYTVIGGIGYVALYIAAFLTLWSMVLYLRAAWPNFTIHSESSSKN
jgi:CDP-diacylglycerol--glycerol-3-phosphate 3-phosphatidyltransferase